MWFSRYKKTNNKPKGLLLDGPFGLTPAAPQISFFAPNKIDHRDLCIPTDNQADTPYCTAYSTAGYLEIKHWQKKHFPKQYPAVDIYKGAKEIDGYSGDGSWIRFAVESSKNLGLIKGDAKYIVPSIRSIKFAILEFGACIGAFNITNEWNKINRKTGRIVDFGDNAITLGGHAVLICGYDKEGVYIQNSWGKDWGIWGFGLLSWELFQKQFVRGIVIDNIEVL